MPPQPLSKIRPDAGISFCPELAIERPDVCAQIAHCITCWAWVETQVSRLFVLLSKTNAVAAVELYNSFGGASLKENSIKVLARSSLPLVDFRIIESLLKVVQSHQKLRDKICHWYWGLSSQITDGLVLTDPKNLILQQAKIADLMSEGRLPTIDEARIPIDEIYVYRISDLQADAKAFIALAQLVNKCHRLCLLKGAELVLQRDELFKDALLAGRLNPKPSTDR